MREKILNPWFYDRTVNLHVEKEETNRERYESMLREQKKAESRLDPTGLTISDQAFHGTPAELKKTLDEYIESCSRRMRGISRTLRILREAKPFLIGPATLDSLINNEPESYEYVSNERLPFDCMFFEFPEPFRLGVPFEPVQEDVKGMLFYKTVLLGEEFKKEDLTHYKYTAIIYYQTNRGVRRMRIIFNPDSKAYFLGELLERTFKVDMDAKIVKYGDPDKKGDHMNNVTPLADLENNEVFYQIANLCTNLVNYINAHNITVVKRSRKIEVLQRNERGKKKKITRDQPYYLIEIKSGVIEEPEIPTGKSWELQWRVYVRGHNRRLRDEDDNIRMITWIPPHVKGPIDAPWKNQRYVLLADKLKREKEMYRK